MKFRKLGRTDLNVSEIGYGMWGMGKNQWRDAEDPQSRASLKQAFDLGVNFYDTALAYGEGHSESLLSDLSRTVGRDKIIVATKAPPLNREWPARCGIRPRDVFPPKYIRKCAEISLKNLRSDYVDLFQLHVWQDHWLEEPDWLEELHKLKKEGKIRFVGVSVNDHDPTSAILLAQQQAADVLQVIYNIYDPSPDEALFPLCKEHHIGIIARCPFDEGSLSGTLTATSTFPKGDFREMYFAGNRLAEVEKRANRLKDCLDPEAKSLPELALRFCLSNPVVSTVIPGMRKPSHVEANCSASDGKALTPTLLEKLKSHAWPKNFYP
jgi:aryl-alcohol dehydrogenase-like predicted oxidoreductase